ncbi:hypothetical protein AGMMS49940_21900 [Spirochaetia bacterium]|nr:hypothetical protein AGMMS49940_21900 [Spirochaetia bacterium]
MKLRNVSKWVLALLALALIFAGCEGPVGPTGEAGSNGSNGTDGTSGGGSGSGQMIDAVVEGNYVIITFDDYEGTSDIKRNAILEDAFNQYDAVYLVGGTDSKKIGVTVPAGKTVYIAPGSFVDHFNVASAINSDSASRAAGGVAPSADGGTLVVLNGATVTLAASSINSLGGTLIINRGGIVTQNAADTSTIQGTGNIDVLGKLTVNKIAISGDLRVAAGDNTDDSGDSYGVVTAEKIYTNYLNSAGNVKVWGTINLTNGASGLIRAGGDVFVAWGGRSTNWQTGSDPRNGLIKSSSSATLGNVQANKEVRVYGKVEAHVQTTTTVLDDADVEDADALGGFTDTSRGQAGDVIVGEDLTAGGTRHYALITGDITADTNVLIRANGDTGDTNTVSLQSGSTGRKIDARGTVTVEKDGDAHSWITADGDVTVSGEVFGYVTTGGKLIVNKDDGGPSGNSGTGAGVNGVIWGRATVNGSEPSFIYGRVANGLTVGANATVTVGSNNGPSDQYSGPGVGLTDYATRQGVVDPNGSAAANVSVSGVLIINGYVNVLGTTGITFGSGRVVINSTGQLDADDILDVVYGASVSDNAVAIRALAGSAGSIVGNASLTGGTGLYVASGAKLYTSNAIAPTTQQWFEALAASTVIHTNLTDNRVNAGTPVVNYNGTLGAATGSRLVIEDHNWVTLTAAAEFRQTSTFTVSGQLYASSIDLITDATNTKRIVVTEPAEKIYGSEFYGNENGLVRFTDYDLRAGNYAANGVATVQLRGTTIDLGAATTSFSTNNAGSPNILFNKNGAGAPTFTFTDATGIGSTRNLIRSGVLYVGDGGSSDGILALGAAAQLDVTSGSINLEGTITFNATAKLNGVSTTTVATPDGNNPARNNYAANARFYGIGDTSSYATYSGTPALVPGTPGGSAANPSGGTTPATTWFTPGGGSLSNPGGSSVIINNASRALWHYTTVT